MQYAVIDKTLYPVVVFRFNPVEVSVEEHAAFLESQKQFLTQHSGCVFVYDLTQSKALSAEVRIQQGYWNRTNAEFLAQHLQGIAFVANSVMMSFVFKGIFLIQKPPVAYTVVAALQDGIDWANALTQTTHQVS
jgi:hypothetical protein